MASAKDPARRALQLDYTVHKDVISALRSPDFGLLWQPDFEFGAKDDDAVHATMILNAAETIRCAYGAAAPNGLAQVSDTLVTKVMLAVFGCFPACDRYFRAGFRQHFPYSYVNENLVHRILVFCQQNLADLRGEQRRIERRAGLRYPLMELVDMYFWQIGFELEARRKRS